MGSRWMTVNQAARRLQLSRWDVLMRCLHRELTYRPTALGVEVSEHSVRALELARVKAQVTGTEGAPAA
jgi:hypothetical protein